MWTKRMKTCGYFGCRQFSMSNVPLDKLVTLSVLWDIGAGFIKYFTLSANHRCDNRWKSANNLILAIRRMIVVTETNTHHILFFLLILMIFFMLSRWVLLYEADQRQLGAVRNIKCRSLNAVLKTGIYGKRTFRQSSSQFDIRRLDSWTVTSCLTRSV